MFCCVFSSKLSPVNKELARAKWAWGMEREGKEHNTKQTLFRQAKIVNCSRQSKPEVNRNHNRYKYTFYVWRERKRVRKSEMHRMQPMFVCLLWLSWTLFGRMSNLLKRSINYIAPVVSRSQSSSSFVVIARIHCELIEHKNVYACMDAHGTHTQKKTTEIKNYNFKIRQ